mmetsp:Transcript_772/g.1028  ORF Transcript_772/g.1028 Transcript_772/m.1028 type:complete len:220 (-) Transcript_772:37-696(-)
MDRSPIRRIGRCAKSPALVATIAMPFAIALIFSPRSFQLPLPLPPPPLRRMPRTAAPPSTASVLRVPRCNWIHELTHRSNPSCSCTWRSTLPRRPPPLRCPTARSTAIYKRTLTLCLPNTPLPLPPLPVAIASSGGGTCPSARPSPPNPIPSSVASAPLSSPLSTAPHPLLWLLKVLNFALGQEEEERKRPEETSRAEEDGEKKQEKSAFCHLPPPCWP